MSTPPPDSGGPRRPYPEGDKVQVTETWKRLVDRRLEELGKTRTWLADEVGCDKSLITKLLTSGQNTSALVAKICETLDLPSPVIEVQNSYEPVVIEGMRHLTAEDVDHIMKTIEHLREVRSGNKK